MPLSGPHTRRTVDDRWFNITGTIIVQGAEDPSFGLYTCSVCTNRGTPEQACNNATLTLYLVGSPPALFKRGISIYHPTPMIL